MSSVLFYLFHCNLKKKDPIRTMINSTKKMFICVITIIINLICRKLGLGHVQQKNKLPSPEWYIVLRRIG